MPCASSGSMPFRCTATPPLTTVAEGPLGPLLPLCSSLAHLMGSHCQRLEVIFSTPLPSCLVEPAWARYVLVERGVFGIFPASMGSPS